MYDEIVARLASGKPEVDVLNELQERLGALTQPPRGGRGRERSKANRQALVDGDLLHDCACCCFCCFLCFLFFFFLHFLYKRRVN